MSTSNRPVASPYPKLMTSNLNVDQGGAVVMCSADVAEQAGGVGGLTGDELGLGHLGVLRPIQRPPGTYITDQVSQVS